ncbi:MAG TPA: GAF domain-containing protein, partial [Anaerolineae bacterium]|nr:GAF domain-containing protein [Anaerolineae bacterium]
IVLDWNPAAERVYGYSRAEIVGKSIAVLFPPELEGESNSIRTRLQRGESIQNYNTLRIRKDGTRVNLSVTISPVRDDAGNIIAASTIARDETERIQLEQSRTNAINILNAVVEGTTDVIYVKDLNERYLMINRAGIELAARAPQQIIGKSSAEIFDEETGQELRAEDELVIRSGKAQTFESILPSARGKRIFHTVKAPYRNGGGNIIGVIGVSRDVTELREAELSIARQAALLDLTPAAVLVRTLQGKILFWSRGAEQLYGWTREEALDQISHTLFRTEFSESLATQEAALLNQGHWEGDLTHHTRDGSTVYVASRQVVQRDERGNPLVILEVNTDITDRKRTEQEQAFLVRAADVFNASLDFEITLENIAELAIPFLADWCSVHILTETGTIRRLVLAHHDPAVAARAMARPQEYPLDENAQYLVPHILRTGTAEFYNDVPDDFLEKAARDEEHREHLRAMGFNAYIALPLQARGRTLGVVTFVMSDSGRRYSTRDFELARELVARASLATDNALLYQESQAAQTRTKLLAEASNELLTSIDYETRLQRLAQLVVPRFADWCAINLLSENGAIRLAALAHAHPEMVEVIREWAEEHPLSPHAPFGSPHVIRTGKPEWVPVVTERMPDWAQIDPERAPARAHFVNRLQLQSYIIVPLIARGRTFGAINFSLSESGRRYGFQDLLIAEELARRAATALDNAALFQQEQESRREAERNAARVAALQRVTAAFAATLTREQVAHVVLEQASEALGAQGGVLGQLTDDGTTITVLSAMGYPSETIERWRSFSVNSDTPLARVIRSGELLAYESLESIRAAYPSLANLGNTGYGAWLVIPLKIEGRTLGGLHLGFPTARPFSATDRAFALALAQQCAQALEHARLYESELNARAAAEQAAQRSEWLTKASHLLASSLEYEETLKQLAQLIVPELADWCQIHIAKDDGTAELLVLSHKDPQKVKWAQDYGQEIRQYFTPDWNSPRGLPHVLRSGESEIYYDLPDEFLQRVTQNQMQYKILKNLGLSSVMIVPLNTQGKTLGAITLINMESRRHFTDDDLEFAELLAERAAVAIENARLYRQTQTLNAELEARVQQRTYELSNAYDDLHAEIVERTRAEETTRALLRISSRLNSTLDVAPLLELLMQEVLRLVDAQSGFAGLRTPRGMEMQMYFKDGKSHRFHHV